LVLESGAVGEWRAGLPELEEVSRECVGGCEYVQYRLGHRLRFVGLPAGRIPLGCHRLWVTSGALQGEATLISAPRRCWAPIPVERRPWGVFAPLYALRSDRDWGAGDLAELGRLREWVAEAGGEVVATLPLLAAYLDVPFEPAPYRPVSRLFWNEFYVVPEQTAEWRECPPARGLWEAADTCISRLRSSEVVDYAATMAIKRRVLERLARYFFERAGTEQRRAYDRYLELHPHAAEYAGFRARVESERVDWRSWSGESQAGRQDTARYHLYCQWQMEEQLGRLGREGGAGLFLDIPVGVHPGGFDTWRWHELFVKGMSSGAPPDAFFALGQTWDTSPLHPERIREGGYEYVIAYLRDQMRHARYVRVDHFMAVHRLFWVADDSDPADGVYVTYPAEELYAVLSLESHRNQTVVVGEDLGTVPPEVHRGMRRHGVRGTWVLQAALRSRAVRPIPEPPSHDIVAVNTHDMFPFAGFLRGDDIEQRLKSGQVDRRGGGGRAPGGPPLNSPPGLLPKTRRRPAGRFHFRQRRV
jgi:4-alpha-glucanotransferase